MGKKKDKRLINTITVGMGQNDIIQRYGEASSQYIQSYKGFRVDELGNLREYHGRSLKEISEYKVNAKYRDQNLKQQAGFCAEEIQVARKNQQNILNGDKTRTITTDGLGETNHTQYDHVQLDKTGKIIEGSGSQMKFLKSEINPKTGEVEYKVIDKLANDESWDRYDTEVTIQKDYYEGAKAYAQKKYEKNIERAQKCREQGKIKEAEKYEKKAENYKKATERIKPAEVTQNEALDARLNPERFTAKEVLKGANEAGKTAAKSSFLVASTISAVQNIYAVYTGEKDYTEAAMDIATDSGKAVAIGYVLGSTGSLIKSLMHTSSRVLER